MVLKYSTGGDVLFEWPQRHEQLKGEDKMNWKNIKHKLTEGQASKQREREKKMCAL